MGDGFACARCNQLYRKRPETCHECGHESIASLTFSEYRARRRTGETPWSEASVDGAGYSGVLVALALLTVVLGLVAVGVGVTVL